MTQASGDQAILEAVRAFLRAHTIVGNFIIRVLEQDGPFAKFEAVPTDGSTDPAIGFVRLVEPDWQVLAIGTCFGAESLTEWGVPRSIWSEDALDELRRTGT